MAKHLFSVFHQVVNKLDERGNLKNQTIIDVDKMRESEFPLVEQLRCTFKVIKVVEKEIKTTYITFDASDTDIKIALSDMYAVIEQFLMSEPNNSNYK